jgi:hypothetical protein
MKVNDTNTMMTMMTTTTTIMMVMVRTTQTAQVVGFDEDVQRQRAQLVEGRQQTLHALGSRVYRAHA